jgi:hypothetical protein
MSLQRRNQPLKQVFKIPNVFFVTAFERSTSRGFLHGGMNARSLIMQSTFLLTGVSQLENLLSGGVILTSRILINLRKIDCLTIFLGRC